MDHNMNGHGLDNKIKRGIGLNYKKSRTVESIQF